jgi:hypothetical protein
MGINVQTESERADMISEVIDPHDRTQALLPISSDSAWSCLRFVDRYGDAVFNQLQVPVLISEVRRRLEGIRDRDVKEHCEAVLRLIESAEGKVHTYVRFVGD